MDNYLYDANEFISEPTSRLENPIHLHDIINKCSDFTVRNMDEDEIERNEQMDITQVYSYEELEPYCLPEVLEPPSDDDDPTYDEISNSFPVFRKKMSNVTTDGKVMKLIDKNGVGETVPSEGVVVVFIHYAAYVEFAENPFDVTRLRQKRPERKKLGVGEIIPGLEIAIRTMKKGERAKFLVHPDLAYREKGIPPRIPPQATILYDVDLIDVCEYTAERERFSGERTFDQSYELARKLRHEGTTWKKTEKNLDRAISAYKKGLQILLEASYDNDENEARRNEELILFYSNLAVCYSEKKQYRRVCSMFNDARMDCGNLADRHVKLLYKSGKALRMLGSFEDAFKRLRRANRLEPENEAISKELLEVDAALKRYNDNEKQMCQKMFGFLSLNDNNRDDNDIEAIKNVPTEFKEEILKMLDRFELSDKRCERLPDCACTYAEKEFIRKTCAQKNFLYKTTPDNTILIIKKEIYP